MRFQDQLKQIPRETIWAQYCGFLDLSLEEYMQIQNRLMEEQISLWKNCELGKHLLQDKKFSTVAEFCEIFPLTTYADYADTLLMQHGHMLPDKPVIWIQTTWEGGKYPVKLAPYTKSMLNTFCSNIMACMMLATSTGKGNFDIAPGNTFLYGLAPLPYATGLLPRALSSEIDISFLPPVKEAESMSFSERNKKGFKMGVSRGIDYFFALGSVAYCVSQNVDQMLKGKSTLSSNLKTVSPRMIARFLSAKYRCKREGRDLHPRDLFHLKGFMVAGTDNNCYMDELEELWGIRPLEVFAGTEPTCVGCETWARDGMYFFPDSCFYEFIPEEEMVRSQKDPSYRPKTCLMDEVVAGEKYELVISVFKGGAFMRYRVGDVYRCMGIDHSAGSANLPRFRYIDRTSDVIDIAGFTRVSEASIQSVVQLSDLPVENWIAAKEFTNNNKPFLHMYVELRPEALANSAVSAEILKERLSIYFKYVDQDYKDLKKLLGMDPLEITILRCGTFARYACKTGSTLRRINPSPYEVRELLQLQSKADVIVRKEREFE